MEPEELEFPAAVRRAKEYDDGYIMGGCYRNGEWADVDLTELELKGTRFVHRRFERCNWSRTSFYGCSFERCEFVECQFGESYWRKTVLDDCKGDGCAFRGARVKECRWSDDLLRCTNWNESVWEHVALERCDLRQSALCSARWKGVQLKKVDLTGCELFRTALKGMDLTDCDLDGITLSEGCGELRGAKISLPQAAVVAQILGIQVESLEGEERKA